MPVHLTAVSSTDRRHGVERRKWGQAKALTTSGSAPRCR